MNINGLSQTDWVYFLTPKLNFLYRAAFISPLGRKKSQFSNFKDLCSLLLKISKTWQNTLQDTHKSCESSTRNCVHHHHKEQVPHAGSVPSEKFIFKNTEHLQTSQDYNVETLSAEVGDPKAKNVWKEYNILAQHFLSQQCMQQERKSVNGRFLFSRENSQQNRFQQNKANCMYFKLLPNFPSLR